MHIDNHVDAFFINQEEASVNLFWYNIPTSGIVAFLFN